MRTLKEILLAAAAACDAAAPTRYACIRVWRFKDAPPELRALSQVGGDEDWLALVPDQMIEEYGWPSWLDAPSFGCAGVDKYPIAGAVVLIGCHA
jgi:hypothetical protein